MKYLRIILLKLIFLFPISNSFGAMTLVKKAEVFEDGSSTVFNGIEFQ